MTADRDLSDNLADRFRQMLLIRRLDDALLRLRTAGEFIGAVHPYGGHEAIAAGVCGALGEADVIISYYRGMGHAVARGADLGRVVAERLGRETGYCRGRAGEFLICRDAGLIFTAGVIGSGVPIAVGAALATRVLGGDEAVAVFFGDGAFGAGVVHESMNLASIWKLPVVFVCENNGYQDHTRTDQVYPSVDLVRYATANLIPGVAVDGNDVEAVSLATTEALSRARSGGGPALIEAKTYLRHFHLQFDDPPPRYRPAGEEASWLARDPLERTRRTLLARGWTEASLVAVEQSVAAEVDSAITWASSSPCANPDDAADSQVVLPL